MRNQLLRDSDWAGMAHSLEIRLPLVDVHLFESIAALGRFSKQEMADVPLNKLPPEILDRPKSGFNVPMRAWLMQDLSLGAISGERGLRGWARYVLDRHLGGA
jgi:asparagine synthase (glutamine-hydrolysing)